MASEIEYSPAQVGQHLGVKPGMVRRYHLAYETVTGEELRRDARDEWLHGLRGRAGGPGAR